MPEHHRRRRARTLEIVGEHLPLTVHEVPTGTQVLDWTVPQEWNIRDAYVADAAGRRVIDFRESNLHVVGYSVPVHDDDAAAPSCARTCTRCPTSRTWCPYRTSYYAPTWGFCLAQDTWTRCPTATTRCGSTRRSPTGT